MYIKWTKLAPSQQPSYRAEHSLVYYDGAHYLTGGNQGGWSGTYLNDLWKWDFAVDNWVELNPDVSFHVVGSAMPWCVPPFTVYGNDYPWLLQCRDGLNFGEKIVKSLDPSTPSWLFRGVHGDDYAKWGGALVADEHNSRLIMIGGEGFHVSWYYSPPDPEAGTPGRWIPIYTSLQTDHVRALWFTTSLQEAVLDSEVHYYARAFPAAIYVASRKRIYFGWGVGIDDPEGGGREEKTDLWYFDVTTDSLGMVTTDAGMGKGSSHYFISHPTLGPVLFAPGDGSWNAYQMDVDAETFSLIEDDGEAKPANLSWGPRFTWDPVHQKGLLWLGKDPWWGGSGTPETWEFTFVSGNPEVTNQYPSNGSSSVDRNTNISFSIEDETQIDLSKTLVTVEGETVYNGSVFSAGWTSSTVSANGMGYDFLLVSDSAFHGAQLVNISVYAENTEGNNVTSVWSFTTDATDISLPLCHQFNVNRVATISHDIIGSTVWNQFDEHGLIVGLKRLPVEKNWPFRRRIFDAFVNRANSTYRGMVNAVTRELGLSFFYPITISPRISPYSNTVYADDPYVLFDGTTLYLYHDYKNERLQVQIDILEQGGNYELFGRLVDYINSIGWYFEASLLDEDYRYTRCSTLLKQSSREIVEDEPLSASTRSKLSKSHLVSESISFTDNELFYADVKDFASISRMGDYYMDTERGIVGSYIAPPIGTNISYYYSTWPWKPIASPVILHSLSDEGFQRRLYKQILLDDNTYTDGLPTALATDVINTLLRVYPLYWGI